MSTADRFPPSGRGTTGIVKDEVEAGAKAALGGRSAAARPDLEQEKRIKQLERALGRSHLQIEILKNVLGE